MNRYTKIISTRGTFFTKDFEKKKKDLIKVRKVNEDTVRKFFLEGDCEILVIFDDTGKEVTIDYFSSEEDKKKYLGASFIR